MEFGVAPVMVKWLMCWEPVISALLFLVSKWQ